MTSTLRFDRDTRDSVANGQRRWQCGWTAMTDGRTRAGKTIHLSDHYGQWAKAVWAESVSRSVRTLRYRALLNLDQRRYSAAESDAGQSLDMYQRLGGEESPDVASSLNVLGIIKEVQGDWAPAESLFRKAISIRQKELHPGHPDLVVAEVRLGEVLSAENKLDLAEPFLSDAEKSVHNSRVALLSWQISEADSAMGILLIKEGKPSQAYPLLRDAEKGIQTYSQSAMKRRILQTTSRFGRSAASANDRKLN